MSLGTSPPILSGPLARVPILSSPNLSDNNNLGRSPVIPFCTRAVTLPEISEMGNYPTFFNETSTTNDAHPITFLAPELPEETLLEVTTLLGIKISMCYDLPMISEGTQRDIG